MAQLTSTVQKTLGRAVRKLGQAVDAVGAAMQGSAAYTEGRRFYKRNAGGCTRAVVRCGHVTTPCSVSFELVLSTVVPSTRVVGVRGSDPSWGIQAFVASSASVVGNVTLGELASVWYGATVKGA